MEFYYFAQKGLLRTVTATLAVLPCLVMRAILLMYHSFNFDYQLAALLPICLTSCCSLNTTSGQLLYL